MTAREYLGRAYFADARISEILSEESRLRSLAERATASFGDTGGGGGSPQSRVENYGAKLAELHETYRDAISEMASVKREVAEAIFAVKNPRAQYVLTERYIGYASWRDIAQKMHYDVRTVLRYHKKGLQEVQEWIDR